MNTASAGISLAALLSGQPAADSGDTEAGNFGDFTNALAAAAAPQLFAAVREQPLDMPSEDMPSAAALAFLAGLLNSTSQPEGGVVQDGIEQIGDPAQPAANLAQRQAAVLALLGVRAGQPGSREAATIAQTMDDVAPLTSQAAGVEVSSDIDSLFSVLAGSRGAETAARPASDPASMASLLSAAVTASGGSRNIAPEQHAQAAVKQHVGTAGWADEVGSRLVMMSLRGQHEGSLTLSPEHLGPLEVRISVSQDRADVWFGAQHAETRAALHDALPRLRELFAASGMSLGQAGVSQDMPGQEGRASGTAGAGQGAPAESTDTAAPTAAAPVVQTRGLALLDTWA